MILEWGIGWSQGGAQKRWGRERLSERNQSRGGESGRRRDEEGRVGGLQLFSPFNACPHGPFLFGGRIIYLSIGHRRRAAREGLTSELQGADYSRVTHAPAAVVKKSCGFVWAVWYVYVCDFLWTKGGHGPPWPMHSSDTGCEDLSIVSVFLKNAWVL
jgi:hypothetical protein